MINYTNLRPLDAVCTSTSKTIGKLIRLRTASLVGKNPFREMFNTDLANHVGLIVEMEGRYWIAEMLGTGLEINSLNDYIGKKTERIVSVKRIPVFDDIEIRKNANEFIIASAQQTLKYDWDGIFEFVGVCKDNPSSMYCSEYAEVVANKYNATWSNFQLKRSGKKSRIAPCEIQYGKGKNIDWLL
jgi:hypothetical protein